MNGRSHALGDFRAGKMIASGGFGSVFTGKAPDGKRVAIKYERTYSRIIRPYLRHEADVYRLLEGHPCVPKVHAYGREERFNIMVFDYLGTSLETLFEKCGGKFSPKTMLMLAPQIIEAVEYCHSKGIIHRDMKPDNLLMGIGDRANFVHIIDFGLARRYRHPRTLEHFPYFEGHSFFGTTRFASLKALEGCSQSRRDDLESVAYSLVYFVRGRLPWQGLRGGTEKHRDQRVREKKRTWTPERLCEGLPGAEELIKMLHHVKSLDYTDEPDYAYLKGLFKDRFEKEGFELDYDYDWLHIVEKERDIGDGLSSYAASSIISAGSRNADDEAERPSRKVSGHLTSKPASGPASGPVPGKLDAIKTDSEISPLSAANLPSKHDVSQNRRSGSQSNGSGVKKSGEHGSDGSRKSSHSSKHSYSRHSKSIGSRWSSSASTATEVPIKKGDFVLIKFLARSTLELCGLRSDSNVPIDDSYWHNPSLSEDQWHFPYRMALVTRVDFQPTHSQLTILPIMQRDDGLEKISPARRAAFFKISSASGKVEDDRLELQPTPAWPLDGTYVHHQYDLFRVRIETEAMNDIKVIWRLDKEQLKALLRAREEATGAFDDGYLSDAGSETNEVRGRQRIRRVIAHYPLYGEISSLTEDALKRKDVDLHGSNGWLPEFYKTDRRRNHENGYYTGDSEGTDENISCYTGPAPGNRRLSCTLAIDGDVILEAASERGSVGSQRYHSPRHSKVGSNSSRESSRKRRSSSAAGSAVPSARSLRHAVLDTIARSGWYSPTSSVGGASDEESSPMSSNASPELGSSPDLSSHVSAQAGSSDSSSGSSNAAFVPYSDSNESEAGSPPDARALADSSVSRFSSSDMRSLAASSMDSIDGDANVNNEASAFQGKIMIDKAVQTDPFTQEASVPTEKVMLDKAIQTQA
ncbi:hypothetical protein ACEPAI_6386 [Sanghuangporus weigelae]